MLNMEFSDRLKSRMAALGISGAELAKRVRVSRGNVSHWTSGTNGATGDRLIRLAEVLQCDPVWLETGRGEMTAVDRSTGSPSESDYALIPQYTAKGDCGNGYLNDHVEVNGGLAFKREWLKRVGAKPENLYVFYADSDSMEPYIFDGDVVLFDTSCIEPQDRQVYAIRRPDGGISIKRLVQQLSGAWLVRSDNPDKAKYPDEVASKEVLHDMPIVGRVIWRGGGIG